MIATDNTEKTTRANLRLKTKFHFISVFAKITNKLSMDILVKCVYISVTLFYIFTCVNCLSG